MCKKRILIISLIFSLVMLSSCWIYPGYKEYEIIDGIFYDDGVTVNYDYYPYFLAEQIYQTPTGSTEPGDFVIRPLYTVYNEPFYTSTNNLFFVRG